MKSLACSFSTALALLALLPGTLLAAPPAKHNPKLSLDLESAQPSEQIPVIIQYRSQPGSVEDSKIFALGGVAHRHIDLIHAVHAHVPGAFLAQLATDPNVKYISIDRPVAARQVTITQAEYTTEPINAPQAWAAGLDGSGIGVAVIDSGINNVQDMLGKKGTAGPGRSANRVVYSQNFSTAPDATDQ